MKFAWVIMIPITMLGLVAAYYTLNSPMTSKAATLLTTTCSLGMTVSVLQTMAVIGQVDSPQMPKGLRDVLAFFSLFIFDFERFGFSCVAGKDVVGRYALTVMIVPIALAWLIASWALSQALPNNKFRFTMPKTANTMGAFVQLMFTTVSNVGFQAFMCYSHPNGMTGLNNYPMIMCGSSEHTGMKIFGGLLLSAGCGFLALTVTSAIYAPQWSLSSPNVIQSFKFLLFRYRTDRWEYGTLLIFRGPLLCLPMAIAADYPHVQLLVACLVLCAFLVLQLIYWPWKTLVLNVLDMWVSVVLILLLVLAGGFQPPVSGGIRSFFEVASYAVLLSIAVILLGMVILSMSALFNRKAMGGKQDDCIMNLGRTPDSDKLSAQLKSLSWSIDKIDTGDLVASLDKLHVSDVRTLVSCITILILELGVESNDTGVALVKRVSSRSFSGTSSEKERASKISKTQIKQEAQASGFADDEVETAQI
jgi:hypothetical protein